MKWSTWYGVGLIAAGLWLRSRSKATADSTVPQLTNRANVVVEDDTAEAIETALKALQANVNQDYTRLSVTTPKLAFNFRTIPDKSGCRLTTRGGVNTYWYCP